MSINAVYDSYLGIMKVIRERFDIIQLLRSSSHDKFLMTEMCAFHLRKIIEGIAFGCMIALENGTGSVPRQIKKQWNADDILFFLTNNNLDAVFPSPSIIRNATHDEITEHDVQIVVDGLPQKRVSPMELKRIYKNVHKWTHELNPYVQLGGRSGFIEKYEAQFWDELEKVRGLVDKHVASINGEAYFCVLHDKIDGQVKLIGLSKNALV